MSVKIINHPVLCHYTDNQEVIEVKGNTVGQCLDDLMSRYPDIRQGLFTKDGKLLSYVDLYVNAESAYPDELEYPVHDGDEIHLVLMLAGG